MDIENGIYRTAAGSTIRVSGKHGGEISIDFEWLDEGGCIECAPYFEPSELLFVWSCEWCGGGSADVECIHAEDQPKLLGVC